MTELHTGHSWIRGNGGMPGGDVPLRPEDVTVAEVLRDAGYRTAVIGKWGLGRPGSTGQPDRQGFDYAFGFLDQRHAHRQFTDPPALGRHFNAEDDRDGAEPVVILSDDVWRRRYHGDRGIIGRRVTVNGRPHTVVGVMPPAYRLQSPRLGK